MAADPFALTAQLVDIPSVSHDEEAITDWIESRLRAVPGLEVTRLGHNLIARTHLGRARRVVLAGHTDTVPINDNLPSRLDGEVLWGCGTSDMKAGLGVMIALVDEFASGAEPTCDLTWVFYEAEEVAASFNGLKRIFEERPELVHGDVAILGEPTGAAIEAGCQGTIRLRIELAGDRAHTARPWMGTNAIHRAGRVVARITAYREREPVLDGCRFREATQVVKMVGGVAANVVPDSATLTVNHRYAPDRTGEEAVEELRAWVADLLDDPRDAFVVEEIATAAAPSLTDPLLQRLVEVHGLEVRAKLGWTDVARFAAHGVPAANLGPGDATLAHTRDERVGRRPVIETFRVLREDLFGQ
ncbi:MAG: succinyl-diaminopimelate desuccinylase [Ilumatobacteraceae bacterium]